MPISISPEVHRQRKVEQATILKPKSLSGESRIQISKARSEKKITQNDLNIHSIIEEIVLIPLVNKLENSNKVG